MIKFDTIKEVKSAVYVSRKNSQGRAIFSVQLKRAIVIFFNDKWKGTQTEFLDAIKLQQSNLYQWKQHYKNGLFEEGSSFAVSSVAKTSSSQILKNLQGKLAKTQKQIDLVRQCERNGLKVMLVA